jgi:hypothetical protein
VGEIILLKSEGFHDSSPGFLTIIASIPANITQVDNTASIKDPEVILKYQNSQYYPIQSVLGKFLCSKDVILLVGEDGAARVFYINEMFGSGIAAKTKILKAKVSQKGINSFQQRKQSQNNNNNSKSNEVDEGLVDYYEYYLPAEEKKQSHTAASEETTRNLIASGSFRLTKKSEASMKHREEKASKLQSQKTHRERSQEKYEQILTQSEHERKRKNNNNISSRRKSSGGSSSPLKGMTRSNPVLASPTKFFSKMKKLDKNNDNASNVVDKEKIHSFVTGNNPTNKNKDGKKSSLTISTLEAASESNALPLFELATLTPKEKRVNFLKLQAFLTKNGKNVNPCKYWISFSKFFSFPIDLYPSRYRPLIWRFLLKLPENSAAFSNLGSGFS